MILFLGSGAGVLAASTAASAASWLLATPCRRKIAKIAVVAMLKPSTIVASFVATAAAAATQLETAAQNVLLRNIIISFSIFHTPVEVYSAAPT